MDLWWRCFRSNRTALVSARAEDDEHLIALHPGSSFNLTNVSQIAFQLFENAGTQFAVSHFPSAEPDRSFNFIAPLQPFARMFHAVLVVMIIGAGPKLNFFDCDRDLLFL